MRFILLVIAVGLTFQFAFGQTENDGWARYQSLYIRSKAILEIASKYEHENDLQNAIWAYRETDEIDTADRLQRDLENLLKTFSPPTQNGDIMTAPLYLLTNNRRIPSKRAFVVEVKPDLRAVIRPLHKQIYSKEFNSEVIAYKIDKMLGLNIVPVSVERVWDHHVYSVQIFVQNKRMNDFYEFENDFGQNSYPPGSWKMFVLDYLMGMYDRSPANWFLRAGGKYVAIDNDALFYQSAKDAVLLMTNRDALTTIPRKFINDLDQVNLEFLQPHLGPRAFDSVKQRRDELVRIYRAITLDCGSFLRRR